VVQEFPKNSVITRRSNAFDVESLSPKRRKRILSNRSAASRSRQKKLIVLSGLRDQVQWMLREQQYLISQLNAMQMHHERKMRLL